MAKKEKTRKKAKVKATLPPVAPTDKPSFDEKLPPATLPSPLKIWLQDAWGGWLRHVLPIGIFGLIVLLWVQDVLPEVAGGLTMSAFIIGYPTVSLVIDYYRRVEGVSKKRKVVLLLLLLGMIAASVIPIALAAMPADYVAEGTVEKAGDEFNITPQLPGEQPLMVEVHGKLKETEKAYAAEYVFRLGDQPPRTKIEGQLARRMVKMKVGYKTRGKKLEDLDRKVHHISADLSGNPRMTLISRAGETEGPLYITIRPVPVSWLFFFSAVIPLLLLAGLLESMETTEEKSSLAATVTLVLVFSFALAANAMPGVWFSSLLLGGLMGAVSSALLGWLLPKIFARLGQKLVDAGW